MNTEQCGQYGQCGRKDSMDSVAKGQYGQAQFPEDSGLKGSGQQSTDTFATKEREVNTIEAFLKPTSQAVCNVYNF